MCYHRVNWPCVKGTAAHFPKVTYKEAASKNQPTNPLRAGGKLWGNQTRGKTWYETWGTEMTRVQLLWLLWQAERKTVGDRKERKRQRSRQGVEETAEKAKWCLCGVRKPCVLCLLIGWWSWGGLRATDQRDLQGFAPSSVVAVCQPLPLQTLLPHPWCPLLLQLHDWLSARTPPPHLIFTAKAWFYRKWIRALQSPFPPSA